MDLIQEVLWAIWTQRKYSHIKIVRETALSWIDNEGYWPSRYTSSAEPLSSVTVSTTKKKRSRNHKYSTRVSEICLMPVTGHLRANLWFELGHFSSITTWMDVRTRLSDAPMGHWKMINKNLCIAVSENLFYDLYASSHSALRRTLLEIRACVQIHYRMNRIILTKWMFSDFTIIASRHWNDIK